MIEYLAKLGILTTAIGSGAVYTYLHPILFPPEILNTMIVGMSSIWSLDGLLPIYAIMNSLYFDIMIIGAILVFKLIMGAINGKPEMN